MGTMPNNRQTPAIIMYFAAMGLMTIFGAILLVTLNFTLSYFYSMPIVPVDINAFRKSVSATRGETLDWSTMDETYAACKSSGCRPYINPAELANIPSAVRPFSLHPNSRLVYCNEIGQWKFVNSDRFGFNNNPSSHFDNTDVVLLADSFGTGACIDEKYSIATHLSSSGIRLLNLSVGGHQPLDELATLVEYAPTFKTLVWLFYEGNDTYPPADIEFAKNYLDPTFKQGLRSKESEVLAAFDGLERAWEARSTARLSPTPPSRGQLKGLEDWLDRFFSPTIAFLRSFRTAKEIPFDQHLYERTLSTGRQIASARGANRFIVVYLPSWERFAWTPRSHPERVVFKTLSTLVNQAASEAGFEFLDLTPALAAVPRAELFPYDTHAHYSKVGYEVVSDRLIRAITTQH